MYSSGDVYRVRGGISAQLFTVHAALIGDYSPLLVTSTRKSRLTAKTKANRQLRPGTANMAVSIYAI